MSSTPYESATFCSDSTNCAASRRCARRATGTRAASIPTSIDDVMQALMGPNSGYFRMVTSYWDMAASFVLNGAIDEQMFNDANGEQLVVFAKMEPFLADYRTRIGYPSICLNSSRW